MFDWKSLAQGADMSGFGIILAIILGAALFVLLVQLSIIVGKALIIKKAGGSWWKALVPVLCDVELCKVSGTNVIWAYLNFIATICLVVFEDIAFFAFLVMIFYNCVVAASISKCFGKGFGTTLGLIFIPFIFYMIVGCTQKKYIGPVGCNDPFFAHISVGDTRFKKEEVAVKPDTGTPKYRFCYSCGFKLSESDKFCSGCGKEL